MAVAKALHSVLHGGSRGIGAHDHKWLPSLAVTVVPTGESMHTAPCDAGPAVVRSRAPGSTASGEGEQNGHQHSNSAQSAEAINAKVSIRRSLSWAAFCLPEPLHSRNLHLPPPLLTAVSHALEGSTL